MHQTFYIDIDEEITSIIDRLRHAKAKEIVMVVPKRALLIQSIVNLRILKKEADEAGLQLMMVTQDKLGKLLIEKAGIFVQQKMDNIAEDEIKMEESEDHPEPSAPEEAAKEDNERLAKIGSASYFSPEYQAENSKADKIRPKKTGPEKSEQEKLVNKELVLGMGSDIRKKSQEAPVAQISAAMPAMETSASPNRSGTFSMGASVLKPKVENIVPNIKRSVATPQNLDGPKESQEPAGDREKIQNFFYQQDKDNSEKRPAKPKKLISEVSVSGGFHKWLWVFGILAFFIFAGIAAYLFVPKVKLTIQVATAQKNIDSQITGSVGATSVDQTGEVIPAKKVSVEHELVKKIDSTGSKSVSNQKAKGTVTIYNEYDTNPQPLVATTRLMSKEGKLFRLAKGVTVPGMKKNGETMEKGSVEAEVIADQSGEDFNIEPTTFTIPGFENSPNDKYKKFYAESTKKMAGGGSSSQEANFVTAQDIAGAKEAVKAELENSLKQDIKKAALAQLGSSDEEDVVILDGAVVQDEPVYKLSHSLNEVTETFDITAQVKAEALVVDKKDLEALISGMIGRSGNGEAVIDEDSLAINFGKPIVNMKEGNIEIKFQATGKLQPNLDLAAIESEILGKKEESLKEYLGSFKQIERIQLSYWPTFIHGRIPFRADQVEVVLDKESQ